MIAALGILGAGNMAEAIARGVIGAGLFRPDQLLAADPSPQRREVFARSLGVLTHADNREVARASRAMLLLSVKPQQMADLLGGVGPLLDPGCLVVSIAAGISTTFIESRLGGGHAWRVIRVMPNTPMLVGEGMAAMARGTHATESDAAAVRRLFEAAGRIIEVREDQMDAVTAVSGSGPAYIFYLVEQMIRAATELGLSPDQARQLAVRTALGAAKMLSSSDEGPADLRRKVTSPGGTTQAAISYLDEHGCAGAIVNAVKAAERRGRELGS